MHYVIIWANDSDFSEFSRNDARFHVVGRCEQSCASLCRSEFLTFATVLEEMLIDAERLVSGPYHTMSQLFRREMSQTADDIDSCTNIENGKMDS